MAYAGIFLPLATNLQGRLIPQPTGVGREY